MLYKAKTCLRGKTNKPPDYSDEHIRHCTKPKDTHAPAIRLSAEQNRFKANQQLSIMSLGPQTVLCQDMKSGELTNNANWGQFNVKPSIDG